MTILSVSVTAAGRRLAEHLPYEHVHGDAARTVRARWDEVAGFVLLLATGAAVRIVAPLLGTKTTDPAVVCVDEAGRYVVALVGGHRAGANDLAREVAGLLGAEPVVTTATDSIGVPALDALEGFSAVGDVARVTRALLDGEPVIVEDRLGWPLPDPLRARLADNRAAGSPAPDPGERVARLVVTDEAVDPSRLGAGVVVLHPPSLVAGVGTASGAPPEDLATLLEHTLRDAGLAPEALAAVATIDRRLAEPAVTGLGRPVVGFAPDQLATVAVPNPSDAVRRAVGTPSVAEAAAILAAGPGGALVIPKHTTRTATVAVARRRGPRGEVCVVGLGPGDPAHRTPAATRAVRHADAVVGYDAYVAQCADLLAARQRVVRFPLGAEVARARVALELAATGARVAVVCSGDAGVYAMASPLLELAGDPAFAGIPVSVVPGVSASLAASALLGAPLGHDHAVISLSDLLTPWETIEGRIRAAASADLVTVFYNPRSSRRDWQLARAREILLEHRPPPTPVGLVTGATRPAQVVELTTLGDLDVRRAGMETCVVVGASSTVVVAGRMVTPRGYRP